MIRDVATFVKMNPLTKAHTALTEFPYRTLLLRRLVRSLSSRRALGICAFTAVDGTRTLCEISQNNGKENVRTLQYFEQLWRYDQIVFDASRAVAAPKVHTGC
jgi:hypothetical protein